MENVSCMLYDKNALDISTDHPLTSLILLNLNILSYIKSDPQEFFACQT